MGSLALLALAGLAAGAVNAVVGSGTLITYPLLLGYGLPPVVANATNTLGIVPGSVASAWQYRDRLRIGPRRVARLMVPAAVGALVGSLLVVRLPPSVFAAVVPWLIAAACLLVLVQPRIGRRLARRSGPLHRHWLTAGLVLVGLYGGYFGAAQGIMLMAVLTTAYSSDLQTSNAAKNLLGATANGVGAVVFASSGLVDWGAAAAVAVGAVVGGLVGAPVAQRLPDGVLRALVVGIGVVAIVASVLRR